MKWERSIRECVTHNFYCSVCRRRGIPVARVRTQLRGYHHQKRLYCIYCKRVTNHYETRLFDGMKI